MTDREAFLEKAYAIEVSADVDKQRRKKIREIQASLSDDEKKVVEDEARVRTMQQLESAHTSESFTSTGYALLINSTRSEVIGEWYIDQKKPLEARTAEQVEA